MFVSIVILRRSASHACIQITDAEVIGIITIEINIFFDEGTISQANPNLRM